MVIKTEKENKQELTASEQKLAEENKYTYYRFRKEVKNVMEGHYSGKLYSGETILWIRRLLEEF